MRERIRNDATSYQTRSTLVRAAIVIDFEKDIRGYQFLSAHIEGGYIDFGPRNAKNAGAEGLDGKPTPNK